MKKAFAALLLCLLAVASFGQSIEDLDRKIKDLREMIQSAKESKAVNQEMLDKAEKKKVIWVPMVNGELKWIYYTSPKGLAALIAGKVLTGEMTTAEAQRLVANAAKTTKDMVEGIKGIQDELDESVEGLEKELEKAVREREKLLGKSTGGDPKAGRFVLKEVTLDKAGALYPDKWSDLSGNEITFNPPWGKATYSMEMPKVIDSDGEELTLKIEVKAGKNTRFAPYMVVKGPVEYDATCELSADVSNEASDTKDKKFTVKSQAGDTKEFFLVVGLQDGPHITYHYVRE